MLFPEIKLFLDFLFLLLFVSTLTWLTLKPHTEIIFQLILAVEWVSVEDAIKKWNNSFLSVESTHEKKNVFFFLRSNRCFITTAINCVCVLCDELEYVLHHLKLPFSISFSIYSVIQLKLTFPIISFPSLAVITGFFFFIHTKRLARLILNIFILNFKSVFICIFCNNVCARSTKQKRCVSAKNTDKTNLPHANNFFFVLNSMLPHCDVLGRKLNFNIFLWLLFIYYDF